MRWCKSIRFVALIVLLWTLTACDRVGVERWYSDQQIVEGGKLYAQNCATCHGEQAQGLVKQWKQTLPDGSLPPPPLNGTAHAWHHPLPLLLKIVQKGGALYDGKMPGFEHRLSEAEQYAVLAWVQSQWSDDIYRLWQGDGE